MNIVFGLAVTVLGISTAHAELTPVAPMIARVVVPQEVERNDVSAEAPKAEEEAARRPDTDIAAAQAARIAADLERKIEALIDARVAEQLATLAVKPLVARVD